MTTSMTSGQASRGRFGCFTYGCLFALALIVVLGAGLGYYFVTSVRSAYVEYSSESAPALPTRVIDPQVRDSAQDKFRALRGAFEAGTGLSVDLSSDELSALVAQAGWSDKVDAQMSGDVISAAFAFPLTALGEWPAARLVLGGSASRVFNGRVVGTLSLADGVGRARIDQLTLNGKPLEDMARDYASKWITGALNARDSGKENEKIEVLSRIKQLSVRDSRLHIDVAPR